MISANVLAQDKQVQSHADSLNTLKKIINRSTTVSAAGVGFAGAPAPAWYSFAYLVSIADTNELLAMTDDGNPALRLYAYTGLIHKKYNKIEDVKNKLLRDTAIVSIFSGCIIDRSTVAEALSGTAQWYYEPGLTNVIQAIRANKSFRNELFTSLAVGKQIKITPQVFGKK
jgi:hypothetical protein